MEIILIIAALAAIFAAAYIALRSRRTLEQLERILDEAVQGNFSEAHFDESRLSRAQTSLAHYLSSCSVSARQLEEEKAKIQSLIADISHQTRTPLANVLLYAQLLAEQDLTEEGQRCVAALEEQTGKLQSLIEALVKTSRLETGVLVMHPEKGELWPMLEAAVSQFIPRAAEKDITLSLSPTDAAAVFDPKWTAEALCNLLDNALKYTPEGGKVEVRTVPYEMFCRIDVSDTGPGIPEEEQAKIFQRFYRSASSSKAEGVGIGLYLTRQIVQGQGGYVKVDSRPGKGAVFSLFLPR